MDDSQKIIEELKTEIVSLKIRLARVERFIQDSPDPKENYLLAMHAPQGFLIY